MFLYLNHNRKRNTCPLKSAHQIFTPKHVFTDVDEPLYVWYICTYHNGIAYAYWLGYIYRYECLLHEESSRMVYGAFSEKIMRRAYSELIKSPLGEANLTDSATEICAELDRLLVEKIWPAKSKQRKQLQENEVARPVQLLDNTKEINKKEV